MRWSYGTPPLFNKHTANEMVLPKKKSLFNKPTASAMVLPEKTLFNEHAATEMVLPGPPAI